jgi:hypothetical protein
LISTFTQREEIEVIGMSVRGVWESFWIGRSFDDVQFLPWMDLGEVARKENVIGISNKTSRKFTI